MQLIRQVISELQLFCIRCMLREPGSHHSSMTLIHKHTSALALIFVICLDWRMPKGAACTTFNTLKKAMNPCGTIQMSMFGSAALFIRADILDVGLYAAQAQPCAFTLYFTLPGPFLYCHEHVANFF